MSLTDAFKALGSQVVNQFLPPSRLDPVSILTRALGYDKPNPRFKPQGAKGRDVLTSMRGRGDPLMTYNWYCELPTLPGNISLGWEFVEEATTPFLEFEQQSNYRAGKMYHYPGHYSLGTLSLKLFENSTAQASRYVSAWQKLVMDPLTATYNHPSDYKKSVRITVFDVAKKTAMFLTYEKCWPMRVDPFNFVSGTSDRVMPTLELSTDDLMIQFGQYSSSSIPSLIDNVRGAKTIFRQTDILKEAARIFTTSSILRR